MGRGISQLPISINGDIGAGMFMGIVRRSFLTDNNLLFNERISMVEDGMMHYEIEQKCPLVVRLPVVNYLYRYNPSSATHGISKEKAKRGYLSELERIRIYDTYINENKCVDVPKCLRLKNIAIENMLGNLLKIDDTGFVIQELKKLVVLGLFPHESEKKMGIRGLMFSLSNTSITMFVLTHWLYKIRGIFASKG